MIIDFQKFQLIIQVGLDLSSRYFWVLIQYVFHVLYQNQKSNQKSFAFKIPFLELSESTVSVPYTKNYKGMKSCASYNRQTLHFSNKCWTTYFDFFPHFLIYWGLWRELEREDLEGRLGPCESVCLTICQNPGTSVSLMPCAVRFWFHVFKAQVCIRITTGKDYIKHSYPTAC